MWIYHGHMVHCTAYMYCTVMYTRTALHLHCAVYSCCTATKMCHILMLYFTVLYYITLWCAVLYYSVLYCITYILYWSYCTVLHCCEDMPCMRVRLWWGDVMPIWEGVELIDLEVLIWLVLLIMYHCLHGDIDLAWRHNVHNSQARHRINMYPIKISYPHSYSPRHMMAMNRAWTVREPLCKETKSARKRVAFFF